MFLDRKFFWTKNVFGPKPEPPKFVPNATQTKMYLLLEFDSGVGPTCFSCDHNFYIEEYEMPPHWLVDQNLDLEFDSSLL